MPFTDDEIIFEEKSALKTIFLAISVGLFVVSLFNVCFCTENGCSTGLGALTIGWMAALTVGAGLTWIANPLLIISWILITKNKNAAWFFGLLSTLASVYFLRFKTIIVNEAGHESAITGIGLGFWLWLFSSIVAFIGGLIIRILRLRYFQC